MESFTPHTNGEVNGMNFSAELQRVSSVDDLRSLSAAIMSAVEKAEFIAQETDNWLSVHQVFGEFEKIEQVNSQTEGRIIQIQKMTILTDLDKYLELITENAPADQVRQLQDLISSTKHTFNGALTSLHHFLSRGQAVQRAYEKYKQSAESLTQVLDETARTLADVTQEQQAGLGRPMSISEKLDAIRTSKGTLTKMRSCLRTMKEAMSGIESLTLTVCDLGIADYVQKYKERRTELTDALNNLEKVQAQLDNFSDRNLRVQADIDQINKDLHMKVVSQQPDIVKYKDKAEEVKVTIVEMSDLVRSLKSQGVNGSYERQLDEIKEGYTSMINIIGEAHEALRRSVDNPGTPRNQLTVNTSLSEGQLSARSPRTKQANIRTWIRSKGDELSELVNAPLPYRDSDIQVLWHSIQQFQGELVTKAEELSAYSHILSPGVSDDSWKDVLTDQITNLIDTCSDLGYRLDQHGRLCVQYNADLKSLEAEVNGLEESKTELLEFSHASLHERLQNCNKLLEQVTSCKRRSSNLLQEKLAELSSKLPKSDTVRLHTETNELDSRVSKLKLELKAFQQSLEVSITYHEALTVQVKELVLVFSQSQDKILSPAHYVQPITLDNISDYLDTCQVIRVKVLEKRKRLQKTVKERESDKDCLPLTCNQSLKLQVDLDTRLSHVDGLLSRIDESEANHQILLDLINNLNQSLEESAGKMAALDSRLSSSQDPEANDLEQREVFRTECKSLLREAVTRLEQAEISLEEAEQTVGGVGLGELRTHISECRIRYKRLSDSVFQLDSRWSAQAEQNKHLQFLSKRFDDWMTSAQQVVSGDVKLHQHGLDDMRKHIVSLHDIESSLETTYSWLADIKKATRLLAQQLPKTQSKSLNDAVAARESSFKILKDSLSQRIREMSEEMEAVIGWIHKSGELTDQSNAYKEISHSIIDSETNDDTITTKINSLQELIEKLSGLISECEHLLTKAPTGVSSKQITQLQITKTRLEGIRGDADKILSSLSNVCSVWSKFSSKINEITDYLNTVRGQLSAVDAPGVSLGARFDKYSDIVTRLQTQAIPLTQLEELLISSPFPSPSLKHDVNNVRLIFTQLNNLTNQGLEKYEGMKRSRYQFEVSLRAATDSINQLRSSLQHLTVNTCSPTDCQALIAQLDEKCREVDQNFSETTQQIEVQRSIYRKLDEPISLDTKGLLEKYQQAEKGWMDNVLVMREKFSTARENCHHIQSTMESTEAWLTAAPPVNELRNPAHLQSMSNKLQSELAGLSQCDESLSKTRDCLSTQAVNETAIRINELKQRLQQRLRAADDHKTKQEELLQHKRTLIQKYKTLISQINDCDQQLSAPVQTLHDITRNTQQVKQSVESYIPELSEIKATLAQLTSVHIHDSELRDLSSHVDNALENQIPPITQTADKKLVEAERIRSDLEKLRSESARCRQALATVEQKIQSANQTDVTILSENQLQQSAQHSDQLNAELSSAWQHFAQLKELEAQLDSRVSTLSGSKVMTCRPAKVEELNGLDSHIEGLSRGCRNFEQKIENTSDRNQRVKAELIKSANQIEVLQTELGKESIEKKDIVRIQTELDKTIQSAQKTAQQAAKQPEICDLLSHIQEQYRKTKPLCLQAIERSERLNEQVEELQSLQQNLKQWTSKVKLSISSHVVDAEEAAKQQDEMEAEFQSYMETLNEFNRSEAKRQDENNNQPQITESPLVKQIKTQREAAQATLQHIGKGLSDRRCKIEKLKVKESEFDRELESVEENLRRVQHELTNSYITGPNTNQHAVSAKLEELSATTKASVQSIERMLNTSTHLVTQSARMTRLLELKKSAVSIKTNISNLSQSLQEMSDLSSDSQSETTLTLEQRMLESGREVQSITNRNQQQENEKFRSLLSTLQTQYSEADQLFHKYKQLQTELAGLESKKISLIRLPDASMKFKQVVEEKASVSKRLESAVKRVERTVSQAKQTERLISPGAHNAALTQTGAASKILSVGEGFLSSPKHKEMGGVLTAKQGQKIDTSLFNQHGATDSASKQKMENLMREQADRQRGVLNLRDLISDWSVRLQMGVSSDEAENMLNDIKRERSNLGSADSLNSNPSLLLLAHDLDSLELRTLAELRRTEANEGLSTGYMSTLENIAEEVASCQNYLEQLLKMDDEGDIDENTIINQIPSIEHKVSKLQRQYQTLHAINPNVEHAPQLSEAINKLMNDLQLLQGRLEVIPEETETYGTGESEFWNPNNQHDDTLEGLDAILEEQEFSENVISESELLIRLLTVCHSDRSEPLISTLQSILKSASCQIQVNNEDIKQCKQLINKLQTFCDNLKTCRRHLSLVQTLKPETQTRINTLTTLCERVECSGYSHIFQLKRMMKCEEELVKKCEKTLSTYGQTDKNFIDGVIDSAALINQVYILKSQHEALNVDINNYIQTQLYSEKLLNIQTKLNSTYNQLTEGLNESGCSPMKRASPMQLQSELLLQALQLQAASDHNLDENAGLITYLSQALTYLVDRESLIWIKKDLFSETGDVQLQLKTKFVTLRKSVVHIRTDITKHMHHIHPTEPELQAAYKWLSSVKAVQAEYLSTLKSRKDESDNSYHAAVNEFINDSLSYQCELSERSFLLGLLLSTHTSSNSDTVLLSQTAMKTLHNAKRDASKTQTNFHQIRRVVTEYTESKNLIDDWITEVNLLLNEGLESSSSETNKLLQQLRTLEKRGSSELESELSKLNSKVKSLMKQPDDMMFRKISDQVYTQVNTILDQTKLHRADTLSTLSKRISELSTHVTIWNSLHVNVDKINEQVEQIENKLRVTDRIQISAQKCQSSLEECSRWKTTLTRLFNDLRKISEDSNRTLPHTCKHNYIQHIIDQINHISGEEIPAFLDDIRSRHKSLLEFNKLSDTITSLNNRTLNLINQSNTSNKQQEVQAILSQLTQIEWKKAEVLGLEVKADELRKQTRCMDAVLHYILSLHESQQKNTSDNFRSSEHQREYSDCCSRVDRSDELISSLLSTVSMESLKPALNYHQLILSELRNSAQKLLAESDSTEENNILSTVENYELVWQDLGKELMKSSERSSSERQLLRVALTHIINRSAELFSIRNSAPEITLDLPQDQLLESQATLDVLDRRLNKLRPAETDMRGFAATLSETTGTIGDWTKGELSSLSSVVQRSLARWTTVIQESKDQLDELVEIESLHMNSAHLTLEELLENMTHEYNIKLGRSRTKINQLLADADKLLPLSSDMYESAVNHAISSLLSGLKHTERLATSRQVKLRETLAAILEFESGMFSLKLWLTHTEELLMKTPTDWSETSLTRSDERLKELERTIESHGATVTAVVNLCTVLQSDRDASYSSTDRHVIQQVSQRLQQRWNHLCVQLTESREFLNTLSSAWGQVRDQIHVITDQLQSLQAVCQPTNQKSPSAVLANQKSPSAGLINQMTNSPAVYKGKIRKAVKEVEGLHEEMKLLNQRYRYLVRQNMVDSGGHIKQAVNSINELWDECYHKLTTANKSLSDQSEMWMEFKTKVANLLAAISSLSLALKTEKKSRDEVTQQLEHYWCEIDEVFCVRSSELRHGASVEESISLDKMLADLQASLDTLKSELHSEGAGDSTQQVEDLLNKSFKRSEDLVMKELKEEPAPVAPPSPSISEVSQKSLDDTRLSDLERRVGEAEKRSRTRRRMKLSPKLEQVASKGKTIAKKVAATKHPLHNFTASGSLECLDKINENSVLNTRLSQSLTNLSTNQMNSPSGSSTPFKQFLRARSRSSDRSSQSSDRPTHRAQTTPGLRSPAMSYESLNSSVSTLSLLSPSSSISSRPTDRSRVPRRFRSFSSERSLPSTSRRSVLPAELWSPSSSGSVFSPGSPVNGQEHGGFTNHVNGGVNNKLQLSNTAPLTINILSPHRDPPSVPASPLLKLPLHLMSSPQVNGRRSSIGSMSSVRSMMSPHSVTTLELDAQEKMVNERMQLEKDIKSVLEWMNKTETLTQEWTNPNDDLQELSAQCHQYNLIVTELNHYKSIILSINLLSHTTQQEGGDNSELNMINSRWKKLETAVDQRRSVIRRVLTRSEKLSRKLEELSDQIMSSEVKLMSGVIDKHQVNNELRAHLKSARKLQALFTPIINADKEGPLITVSGKPVLESLRSMCMKCEALMNVS